MFTKLKDKWKQKQEDTFFKARVQLTKWYLLILIGLIAGFTYLTFQAKESAYVRVYTVVSNYNQEPNKLVELEDTYAKFNLRFKQRVIWLDIALIILGGLASWWLAGKTLKPIELMMEEQSVFAGDVSHGLRTPLASMKLQIDAFRLKQKRLPKLTAELLHDFGTEINHMTRIVEGVLVLARTKPNQAGSRDKTNLKLLLNNTQKDMKPLALAKKQKFRVEKPPEELWLKGNADVWLQVMIILTDNAIKYTPLRGEVNIETEGKTGFVRIIVKDNGPGVAKEEQKKIFETYYRGKQKAKVPGAGLGLAIAARMVMASGGTIRLTDNVPHGAKFTLRAPLWSAEALKSQNRDSL